MFNFIKDVKADEAAKIQSEFVENVQRSAGSFVQDMGARASSLDYSQASVAALDGLLDEARQGALTLEPLQRLGMAAYFYEVARGACGGLYEVCDEDDPVVLVTGEPEFDVCLCAISKVESLSQSEKADDTLAAFFQRYLQAVQTQASITLR